MNTRTVDLISYFPRHLNLIREFIQVCAAEDAELQLLWEKLAAIVNNMDMYTMDEEMCERWERFFGITNTSLQTLEERRMLIRGYFASQLPYTEKKLRQVLDSMCGEDKYGLTIRPSQYSVLIELLLSSKGVISNVNEVVRQIIPAHLALTVSYQYNRYEYFLVHTYHTMEGYTWKQLREDEIFLQEFNTHGNLRGYTHGELEPYTHMDLLETIFP